MHNKILNIIILVRKYLYKSIMTLSSNGYYWYYLAANNKIKINFIHLLLVEKN